MSGRPVITGAAGVMRAFGRGDWTRGAVLLLALGCVGSCSFFSSGHPGGDDPGGRTPHGLVFSPNGDPMNGGPLGRPTCAAMVDRWIERVDAKHVGRIDHDAFIADARVQFARMDLDHDGYLTASELSDFREPYERPDPKRPDESKGESKGRRDGERTPAYSNNEPVMSADTNLRFKVSLDDFLRQAEKVFLRLDPKHGGAVDRDALLEHCAAQIPQKSEKNEPRPKGEKHPGRHGGGGGRGGGSSRPGDSGL